MIMLAVTAFAASVACTGPEARSDCSMLSEASTRVRVYRRSCSGLDPIEKLYSVGIEGGLVCLPLASIVSGQVGGRIPAATLNRPPTPPDQNPPAAAPGQ